MSLSLIEKIERTKLFTENEAWFLFKFVALAEAVGWTLLIIGVLIHKYSLPGHNVSIQIAGQLHGTIFLIYFAIVALVYSSTGWSRKKILFAIAAGVPPYGTLVFEQCAAYIRCKEQMCSYVV